MLPILIQLFQSVSGIKILQLPVEFRFYLPVDRRKEKNCFKKCLCTFETLILCTSSLFIDAFKMFTYFSADDISSELNGGSGVSSEDNSQDTDTSSSATAYSAEPGTVPHYVAAGSGFCLKGTAAREFF